MNWLVVAILLAPAPDAGDACGELDAAACAEVAEKYRYAEGLGEGSRAVPLFLAACERGHAESCNEVAWLGKDDARTLRLLRRGCDLGSGQACLYIAQMYMNGRGGLEKNAKAALEYYELGCAKGYDGACANASALYGKPGYPKDPKHARELMRRARELGWYPPHEGEEKAKPWKGTLYCASLRATGVVYDRFACARDAATCAQVAKEIMAAEPNAGDETTPCKPAQGTVLLHCASRAGRLACSAQEPFCEALLEAAAAQGVQNAGSCRLYRRRKGP